MSQFYDLNIQGSEVQLRLDLASHNVLAFDGILDVPVVASDALITEAGTYQIVYAPNGGRGEMLLSMGGVYYRHFKLQSEGKTVLDSSWYNTDGQIRKDRLFLNGAARDIYAYAAGAFGKVERDGVDGITPHIDPVTRHWMIGDVDTGILARGTDGESAYQTAVNEGYQGTQSEWIASLHGLDGKSAYEIWVEQPGNEGKSVSEFLASLKESGYKMQAVTARPSTIAGIEADKIYLYPDGTGQFSTAIYTGDLNESYDSTKWVVLATNPGDLSGAFTDINGLRIDVNNLGALVGYYVCDTAAATDVKTVNATGYVLTNGGNIHIKMTYANTAASGVTLQIGSAAAQPLYYNNEPVTDENTWEDNEVVTVYYDGSIYQAYSSKGEVKDLKEDVNAIDNQIYRKSYNLISTEQIVDGFYYKYNPSTTAVELTEQANTSCMKIDVHTTNRVIILSTSSSLPWVIFLDENDNYISQIRGANASDDIIVLPDGTYYIAVNCIPSASGYRPVVYDAGNPLKESVIDEMGGRITDLGTSVYNSDHENIQVSTETGKYLDKGIPATSASTTNYKITDFVEVEDGEDYYFNGTCGLSSVVFGYDSAYNPLFVLLTKSDNDNSQDFANVKIPIKSGTAYIRANGTDFNLRTKSSRSRTVDLQNEIAKIKDDVYTSYKEVSFNVNIGLIQPNGINVALTQTGYRYSDYIPVEPKSKIYVNCWIPSNVSTSALYGYYKDANDNYVLTEKYLGKSEEPYSREEVQLDAQTTYIRLNTKVDIPPKLFVKAVGTAVSKKIINRNVRWVGMSIWWYDGNTLASGPGGDVKAIGYQTLLNQQFQFLSDNGTITSLNANSLGATAQDVADSNYGHSLILKLMNNQNGVWGSLDNAIWTLDTITNDFKNNIPLGTSSDYDNNTGPTTYYGALRIFADKVVELSGNDAIVIVANALRRNNGGYTSTSSPIQGGPLLEDYEKALMYAVVKNGWYFVDQFRLSGITDNTILLTTIDGLHLNNTGYKLAVLPWIAVFDQIYNKLLNTEV